jgi:hypothetical protein
MNVRRLAQAAAGGLLLALSACGPAVPVVMPDVVGLQLDIAKSDIERAGFGGDVEIIGGGMFGVVVESNWVVCEQEPAAGESVADPRLVVERECEPSGDPSTDPIAPDEQPEAVDAVDTTVDELLDRLNSVDMGGVQVGDRFRFTGELLRSDLWSTGATGDYVVLFTAHDGTDDLPVLIDEAETIGWVDGMRVEVIVENVEVTLDGDTSDGWLRVVSATVVG